MFSACRSQAKTRPPGAAACPKLNDALLKLLHAVETRDLKGMSKLMPPDGRLQLSLPDTPTRYTVDEFLKFHRNFFEAPAWTMKHGILNLQCGHRFGIANVEAVYHEPNREGVPYYNRIVISYVFERIKRRWYPIKDHASWVEQSSSPLGLSALPAS